MANALAKQTQTEVKAFMKVVKQKAVERYANDVVQMIDDQKKLKHAYEKVTLALEEVEKGNYEEIERYKKLRARLEAEDGFEF